MSVFGVSVGDLFLLFFCLALPFGLLALVAAALYRRDRRRTPPEARYVAGDLYPRYPRRRPAGTGRPPAGDEPSPAAERRPDTPEPPPA